MVPETLYYHKSVSTSPISHLQSVDLRQKPQVYSQEDPRGKKIKKLKSHVRLTRTEFSKEKRGKKSKRSRKRKLCWENEIHIRVFLSLGVRIGRKVTNASLILAESEALRESVFFFLCS